MVSVDVKHHIKHHIYLTCCRGAVRGGSCVGGGRWGEVGVMDEDGVLVGWIMYGLSLIHI